MKPAALQTLAVLPGVRAFSSSITWYFFSSPSSPGGFSVAPKGWSISGNSSNCHKPASDTLPEAAYATRCVPTHSFLGLCLVLCLMIWLVYLVFQTGSHVALDDLRFAT